MYVLEITLLLWLTAFNVDPLKISQRINTKYKNADDERRDLTIPLAAVIVGYLLHHVWGIPARAGRSARLVR